MYYELLWERLEAKKTECPARLERLLKEEVQKRGFDLADPEKYSAYRDAAQAFVAERIETYNPLGLQYTFEPTGPEELWEFETQLNWYDSRAEFEALVNAARQKVPQDLSPEKIRRAAGELIRQLGAFPDKSIIQGYQSEPTLQKLPDYLVARVVEELVQVEK